jgi:rRNA processing protein Gar1
MLARPTSLTLLCTLLVFLVVVLGGGCEKVKYYEPFNVAQTTPGSLAAGAPRDIAVTIRFSHDVTEETLCASTVFITGPLGNVSATISYDNESFIAALTPDDLLDYSAEYNATVTTGVRAAAGKDKYLNEDYVFSFTTIDPPDLLILAASPSGGAIDAALDTSVAVTFDQELDCSSVTSSSFSVAPAGGSNLAGSLSVDNNIVTFTPDAGLEYSIVYNVTLTADLKSAIATNASGCLPEDVTFSFTTVHPQDLLMVATSPGANTTNVDVQSDVEIIFDQNIDNSSVNSASLSVLKQGGGVLSGTYLLPPATASNKVAFIPDNALEYDTVYQVVLTTDIKSTIATSGGGSLADNISFTFETQPTPPLEIESATPSDGSTGVSISTEVKVVFNTDIYESTLGDLGSGPGFFVNPGATSDNSTAVAATVTYGLATLTATLTPDCALDTDTDYTITIVGGSTGIVGTGGQILPATYTAQFHTRVSSLILSTDPADGETEVDVDRPIIVNFLEPMNTSTITPSAFYLTYGDRFERMILVAGSISFAGGNMTAVFTPASSMEFDTEYTVTLGSGITTADGLQSLTGGYTFSFTANTPPLISTTRAVNDYVTVEPLSGAADVPVLADYEIVFSRQMDPATIFNATVVLADVAASTQVNGSVILGADNITAAITIDARLEFDTLYKITLAGGASGVFDNEGNFLEEDFTFTFTTSEANLVDAVPVVTTSERNHRMVAIFSKPIASKTVNDLTFYVIDEGSKKIGGLISISGDLKSIYFTAIPEYESNTQHTAYFTTGIKDSRGNPLESDFTAVFRVQASPDENTPSVLSVSPSNGATDVSGDVAISVTFDEHIIPASFRASSPADNSIDTILLSWVDGAETKYISGTTSYIFDDLNERTAAYFTPADYLDAGVLYTVTVTTGVCDLATIALDIQSQWTFTIESTAPLVDSNSPTDLATDVASGSAISVTFDENMDPASFTGSNFVVTQGGSPIGGSILVSGNTATFTPDTYMTGGMNYIVTVYDNVTDFAGNVPESDHSFSFDVENTAITVTDVSPADNVTGIDSTTDVVITFSEAPSAGTVRSSTVSTPGTIRVTGPDGEVYGDITIEGNIVTFNPAEDLQSDATYTVMVTTEVADLGGTNLDQDAGTGGNQEYSSTFSTSP